MGQYRIVKQRIPKLSSNYNRIVDFVPKIEYEYIYDVEFLSLGFFGLFKKWLKYKSFDSFEKAKAQIDLLKENKTFVIYEID